MSSQLGWVQISRALNAGRAGARRGGWGDDERRARPSDRERSVIASHPRRHGLRFGWAFAVVAIVAVTIATWAASAGATPLL